MLINSSIIHNNLNEPKQVNFRTVLPTMVYTVCGDGIAIVTFIELYSIDDHGDAATTAIDDPATCG